MLETAQIFAQQAHKNQLYDGKDYYTAHILQVYNRVNLYTKDVYVLCAAVLHDALEDCDDSKIINNIYAWMNHETIKLIQLLTNKESRIPYFQYIENIMKCKEASLIKYCDLQENILTCLQTPQSNISKRKLNKYYNAITLIDNRWEFSHKL